MEAPILVIIVLTILLASLGFVFTQGTCRDVDNCSICDNPPQECTVCGPGKVLRQDGSGCDDCPTACGKCDYNDNGEPVICLECYNSFNGHNYVKSSFGVCEGCSANCLKCSVPVSGGSTECDVCGSGFVRDERTKACSRCPLGCAKCNLKAGVPVCVEVIEGFRLDSSVVTNIAECDANCAQCDKTSCIECIDGFYVAADGTCQSCSSKCTECDEEKCKECYEGYGTKTAATCEACPLNCERCDSGGCIECSTGYAPDSDETYRQCHRCPQNCHRCTYTSDGRTFCSQDGCGGLYALDPTLGTCHKCDENCLDTCVWETQFYDKFLTYNYGIDITVDVNGPVCQNCKRGYGTTHFGYCAKCPENCLACYDDTRYSEMEANGDGIPRMSCSNVECSYDLGADGHIAGFPRTWEITSDHIVMGIGGEMKRSIDDAQVDTQSDDRNKRGVLFVDDTQTYAWPFTKQNCCEFGYSLVYTTNEIFLCSACPAHCLDCSSPVTCVVCEPGYGLSDDSTECIEISPYCYGSDWDDCDTCWPFHENADHIVNVKFISNGVCKKCPDNCLWSDADASGDVNCIVNGGGDTECATCRDYYGVSSGQCSRCENKCVTCAWTDVAVPVYSCSACDDRTVLVNNLDCVDCPDYCADCDGTDGSTCVECDTGYITDSNSLCVACPDACFTSEDCTYNGETQTTVCNTCDNGWIMKDGECTECSENCVTCSLNAENNVVCDVCAQFYGLMDDGTCQGCPSDCAECSNGECDMCTAGFFRNTGDCGYCGDGCETCTESSGSMSCSKCFAGYAVDSNQNCIACPNNCDVCTFSGGEVSCTECKYGSLVSVVGTCVGCADATGVQSCESCHWKDQTAVCDKCVNGYSLKDDASTCISCVALENCNGADDECADLGYVCRQCEEGFALEDGGCGIECVLCDGATEVCGSNLDYNETVFCPTGNCYVAKSMVDDSPYYFRGCDILGLCDIGSSGGKPCDPAGNETCAQCCSSDMCNVSDLSSTITVVADIYLTIAAMLFIFFGNLKN